MTALLGVIGHPIAHSLSPRMQRAAIAALGADAAYLAIDVAPADLVAAIGDLRALGARGLNVTTPHKQATIALLDAIDGEAASIGAVNTIVCEGARWVGSNTDGQGLLRALDEAGIAPLGACVAIVGSGGAARAAAHALASAGAARIDVIARNVDRAEALLGSVRALRGKGGKAVALADRSTLAERLRHADLLVQATSATLSPAEGQALAAALPLDSLPSRAQVLDLVYRPRRTAVIEAAAAQGLRTIDGAGMLLHQGALALERWLDRPAPITAMRAVLDEALGPPGP